STTCASCSCYTVVVSWLAAGGDPRGVVPRARERQHRLSIRRSRVTDAATLAMAANVGGDGSSPALVILSDSIAIIGQHFRTVPRCTRGTRRPCPKAP